MSTRIVVLGAGYSGLVAAKLAARQTNTAVTLVNARDRFVERVRLHQFATGQQLRDIPIEDLMQGTGVEFIVDRVTGIDAKRRIVRLTRRSVGYDILIYALGSQADLTSVRGGVEHAYSITSQDQAERLRSRLLEAHVVAVVGGGLTGLESAAEMAESHPHLKVRLVTHGDLGAALSKRARRHLRKAFRRLGIDVMDNTEVAEVRADGLVLATGQHVSADTVVWTTGFRVSSLARDAGFAVDDHGRMIVDDTLQSVSHPHVYGVGDAAAARNADGQELRMACATGLPAAQHAVHAITDRQAGRAPRPLRFRYINQCISLGRRDGIIQFVRSDDRPIEAVLTGRMAASYKEAIVRGALQVQFHPGMRTSI